MAPNGKETGRFPRFPWMESVEPARDLEMSFPCTWVISDDTGEICLMCVVWYFGQNLLKISRTDAKNSVSYANMPFIAFFSAQMGPLGKVFHCSTLKSRTILHRLGDSEANWFYMINSQKKTWKDQHEST